MDRQVEFLIIDGIRIDVGVLSGIEEICDILDRYAYRSQDGVLHREVIGSYQNYKNIKFVDQTDSNYDQYEQLWEILSSPQEFHNIKIANFEFRAYISSVKRVIDYFDGNRAYHKGMTCSFTAEKPRRT